MQRVATVAAVILLWLSWTACGASTSWLYVMEGTFRQETQYVYRVLLEPKWGVTATIPSLWETAQPWYVVDVEEETVVAGTSPTSEWVETDDWGNSWHNLYWSQLAERTALERRARVVSEAVYGAIRTSDPYPISKASIASLPREALAATDDIQKNDAAISALARAAVTGCVSELEAVARILAAVSEHVVYACSAELCDPVYRVDAVYTLELGKGNCVSYANLALALLRAAGIPAVAANGFVADREESHAGHAWVAVYFPAWGWVEFESADWMPAYKEVPRTFLMPQHITAFLGEGRGLATTGFSEEHEAAFTILERPERKESAAATCRPGQTVAWACAVDVDSRDPTTVELTLDGLPSGWKGTVSAPTLTIDPARGTKACDVLVAVTPPADAAAGETTSVALRATSAGAHVGLVTFVLTVTP